MSPPVTIASPLPLPVKGNVSATVSATVAAQQAGTISGADARRNLVPNLRVCSTPMDGAQ
jgi:hypothetical protein